METCKKVLVDRDLQLGLASRIFTYWCATWFAVFAIPILTQMFLMTDVSFKELATRMIDDLWFPMMISLLILPVAARDCVRYSNRIAGPLCLFKNTLRDFNNGKPVETIRLRKGDYGHDITEELNRLVKKSSDQFPQICTGDGELRVATGESAAS